MGRADIYCNNMADDGVLENDLVRTVGVVDETGPLVSSKKGRSQSDDSMSWKSVGIHDSDDGRKMAELMDSAVGVLKGEVAQKMREIGFAYGPRE